MRAYVLVTGVVFGLVVVAHILRAITEGPALAASPWFLLATAVAAALTVWAIRLLASHRDRT